jgi:hypothetical protein
MLVYWIFCAYIVHYSDRFISGLQTVLQLVSQIKVLRLSVTVHSDVRVGHGDQMDSRYPETLFAVTFQRMIEFHYIIQGEYLNAGDTIYLSYFLNRHPTLKRVKIRLSNSVYRKASSVPTRPALILPKLELFDAPIGTFWKNLQNGPRLQQFRIKYDKPYLLSNATASATPLALLGDIWRNGSLRRFPEIQELTIHQQHGESNFAFIYRAAENFKNLRILDIQGERWVIFSKLCFFTPHELIKL